ncbi:MAG: hypothetical protein EXR72_18720 [Myxococcales bacterium]|nr:hypothetical protein [Myxococcales bacterium]
MATQGKGPGKARNAANALIVSFAIFAGVILINIIGTRLHGRFDLTDDKIHTLSAVSRQTVKDLPDRMTIKAFISSGLQPPLNEYGRHMRDVLDEYAAASGGKVTWEAIDPLAPGKDAEETRTKRDEYKSKYKIRPITLQSVSESKLEIGSDNYLGIALVYGDQIESIPQVASTEGLEYKLTGLIRKLISAKRKKVAFATSEGEISPAQGMQWVNQVVQDYENTSIQLDKPIPDDIDVLISVGAKQPFSDKAKYYIDQFLMKGKPVGLFVDGMVIETPQGMQMPGMDTPRIGRQNDTNLDTLLDTYGLKVRDDLILDGQNVAGPVPVDGQLFLANYPTFIGVNDKGFTPGFALTAKMNALIVPFASSVELTGDLKDGKAAGLTATAIAKTTADHSWRQSGFFVFNPQIKLEKTGEKGPFALGYALEGKLKTAFPNGLSGDGATSNSDAASTLKESPATTRLIVMGSSGLLNQQNLLIQQVPLYINNLLFFTNALDWLAHDDSLIALRSKGMVQRPLVIPQESGPKFWRYFCEIGVPLIVILLGVALWVLRTARRRRFKF